MKIVVLGGGLSTERQVSLVTATSVCKALRQRGHQAVFIDMFLGLEDWEGPLEDIFETSDGLCGSYTVSRQAPDISTVIKSRKMKSPSRLGKNVLEACALADCVFLGLHGADGEDGKIQAALDLIGVPYTGSSPLGSAMAMDKIVAKRIMESAGIRTPEWREIYYCASDIDRLAGELPVPCAVKVINGGSSIGVSLPDNRDELKTALKEMLPFGGHLLIEKKIKGRELTVPVLDDIYLSPIEIVPPDGMTFDYVTKYQSGSDGAREICPAPITSEEKEQIGRAALKLHRTLGLSVYSRTDFILDAEGNAWCLETNTLPGMTPNSLIPKAAADAGISYGELCEKVVELSLKARKEHC